MCLQDIEGALDFRALMGQGPPPGDGAASSRPKALFRTGQSVLHWWSGWFTTAQEPLLQIARQTRPAWFDATFVAALPELSPDVRYAGRMWPGSRTYQVH